MLCPQNQFSSDKQKNLMATTERKPCIIIERMAVIYIKVKMNLSDQTKNCKHTTKGSGFSVTNFTAVADPATGGPNSEKSSSVEELYIVLPELRSPL